MLITEVITQLAKYLRTRLEDDKYYIQYKSTTDPAEFKTAIPEVYCFTMPSSAMVDTYPSRCPAICITLDGRDASTYHLTCHLCVSNASISDAEVAYEVSPNVYELGNESKVQVPDNESHYETAADDDLIIESILFTDQIYKYIVDYIERGTSEIGVEYVDVSLPDYPYAVSSVSLKVNAIDYNPLNELY